MSNVAVRPGFPAEPTANTTLRPVTNVLQSMPDYRSLPVALRPPVPGHPHPPHAALASTPAMSPESFPNALLPIGPLPPTLDFGFSVSIDQINAICSEVEPFENPAVKIKNEYLVAMVKVIVGTSLTKACGHPVHLVEVVNHPDGFVVSFGDNYHFSSMQKTLKKFHVARMQQILKTTNLPLWFINSADVSWKASYITGN